MFDFFICCRSIKPRGGHKKLSSVFIKLKPDIAVYQNLACNINWCYTRNIIINENCLNSLFYFASLSKLLILFSLKSQMKIPYRIAPKAKLVVKVPAWTSMITSVVVSIILVVVSRMMVKYEGATWLFIRKVWFKLV